MGKSKKRKKVLGDDMRAKGKKKKLTEDHGGGASLEHNPKVGAAVDRDLANLRALAEAAEKEGTQGSAAAAPEDPEAPAEAEGDAGEGEEGDANDPYLLADAKYIEKDTRWRNKQRTLVFASRGVTSQFRHLCEDIRKLLPHHKTEPKFEKRSKMQEINEVCELKSCNNVIFFESRKKKDLYMWVARVPSGPTFKFQVLNIHTTGEVRLAGNCLLGSRPLLYFDSHFDRFTHLRLMKALFIQVFGTPRNHPKCKPFHDHVMGFYYLDNKIWFRHYQIAPETPDSINDPERQALTEIGPRFVLDPIRMFAGSFAGQTIYANALYMSPTALRIQARKLMQSPYVKRISDREELKERKEANRLEEDPLDSVFE